MFCLGLSWFVCLFVSTRYCLVVVCLCLLTWVVVVTLFLFVCLVRFVLLLFLFSYDDYLYVLEWCNSGLVFVSYYLLWLVVCFYLVFWLE